MTKASKLSEYGKHLAVIHQRKTEKQIAEEQAAFLMAERNLMDGYELDDWNEKAAAFVKADDEHKAKVEKSFEAVRGRLSVEACLEEAGLLLQSAKDKAAGKAVNPIDPIATLSWLDSQNVTAEDVEQAAEYEREALALVAEIKGRVERNEGAISEAENRASGDVNFSKKLRKLEAQRKKALLAGDDLTKLNADIMAMRDNIEAHKMAVDIARQDAETLKEHGETLAEVLAFVEEVAAHLTARASALYAHSKVVEVNAKAAELAALYQSMAEAKERCNVFFGFLPKVLCQPPTCDVYKVVLPLWRGRRNLPDFKGGTVRDRVKTSIEILC